MFSVVLLAHWAQRPTQPPLLADVYRFYIRHKRHINNGDLVDSSDYHVVGRWLFERDRSALYDLATSAHLWDRRVAVVATYHIIRNNQFDKTIALATLLRDNPHDLIHKALDWMLRETGSRDKSRLIKFLDRYAAQLPSTMLRYAIEKFSNIEQRDYLRR